MHIPKINIFIILGLVILILAGPSYARVDSKAIIAIWLFDDLTQGIVKDMSGNGHDGEIMGSPIEIEGKFGKALEFPGTMGDYLQIPDHDDLHITDAITLLGWVKVDSSGANIVGKDYTGNRNYNIHITSDAAANGAGKLYLSGTTVTAKTIFADGKWHHIAGTWDGSDAKIYADGTEEASVAFAGPISTSDVPVEIGRREAGSVLFRGAIDEVGIFNHALGKDDIISIMNEGLSNMLTVERIDKLPTIWGQIKIQH